MNLEPLAAHPAVRAARTVLRDRDRATVEEQVQLASIPAPSGMEGERGAYVAERFRELDLAGVAVDEVGNVHGALTASTSPGGQAKSGSGGEPILVTAHLDTIFPDGTPITPRTKGDRIFAPGITDNCRGLAAILAIGTAIREAGVSTRRPLVFIATVGEEGVGDLCGVKHLFRDESPFREASAFISIDGAGLTRIVHRAIGSCRLRVSVKGLGGHSWGDRGLANPIHALGLAIGRLRELRPDDGEAFAVNVGRIGGGTSVNAISGEAWLELDLRSEDGPTLEGLQKRAREILEAAVREEIDGSTRGAPLVMDIEKIGDRPCGQTPPDDPLVEAAVAATRLIGGSPKLTASSTDANVPISLGVPALAMGAGGRAGGIHTTDEWYENEGGIEGLERGLLTVLAVAGIAGLDQEA
ncbi:MAG: M20/M25/M40 family metallo-hydrolase [Gemmatimonadota bacterium]